jgi:hypothetical protein
MEFELRRDVGRAVHIMSFNDRSGTHTIANLVRHADDRSSTSEALAGGGEILHRKDTDQTQTKTATVSGGRECLKIGRDGRIRTGDPLTPSQVRYPGCATSRLRANYVRAFRRWPFRGALTLARGAAALPRPDDGGVLDIVRPRPAEGCPVSRNSSML